MVGWAFDNANRLVLEDGMIVDLLRVAPKTLERLYKGALARVELVRATWRATVSEGPADTLLRGQALWVQPIRRGLRRLTPRQRALATTFVAGAPATRSIRHSRGQFWGCASDPVRDFGVIRGQAREVPARILGPATPSACGASAPSSGAPILQYSADGCGISEVADVLHPLVQEG